MLKIWFANLKISNIELKIKVGVDFDWLTNQNLCEKGKKCDGKGFSLDLC